MRVPVGRTTIYRGGKASRARLVACFLATIISPAAGQGRVSREDVADRILALDPRWTVSFETAPSAPAGYDQQMGYVPLKGGELVAIDLNEGVVKWKVALATPLTPATGDGFVFAAGDSAVTALDQQSGRTVWRTPLDSPISTPLYWDSGWLLASTDAGDLIALDPDDGRVLWRNALASPVSVAPTASGDRLYISLRDGRVAAISLESGLSLWAYPLNESVTGVLALEDQLLVGSRSNVLHSFELGRARIRWTQKAGADIAGAPIADDKLIYFAAFDNVLRALDRNSGNLKWTRNLPSRPAGGPLLADHVVLLPFVTTDIVAYVATTGVESFTIRAIGELGGVPFLRENTRPTAPRLIAMSRDGSLQGFSPRVEPPPAPLAELPGVRVGG